MDNPNKGIPVETNGWIEEGKDDNYSNIKVYCPKCGRKLHRTDASKLCGLIFVYCDSPKLSKNSCYWCELYEIK